MIIKFIVNACGAVVVNGQENVLSRATNVVLCTGVCSSSY